MYITLAQIRNDPEPLIEAVLGAYPYLEQKLRQAAQEHQWEQAIIAYVDEVGSNYPQVLQAPIVIFNADLSRVVAWLRERDMYELRSLGDIEEAEMLLKISLQYLSRTASAEAAERMAS